MNQSELTETIATYNEYLQRMADAAGHFCEDLVASNYQEISGVLPALIDGLDWVYKALDSFVKMNYQTTENLAAYRDLVANLSEALENKDYVLLHDLCEFELLPLLDTIRVSELNKMSN